MLYENYPALFSKAHIYTAIVRYFKFNMHALLQSFFPPSFFQPLFHTPLQYCVCVHWRVCVCACMHQKIYRSYTNESIQICKRSQKTKCVCVRACIKTVHPKSRWGRTKIKYVIYKMLSNPSNTYTYNIYIYGVWYCVFPIL